MANITETAETLGHRAWLRGWVESAPFRYTVLAIIFINAIILGLETSPSVMASMGDTLHLVDKIILGIFVIELVLRMYAHGPKFFLDPWGVFDFLIVAIALVPTSEEFSVLRALRILRALRLVSGVPRMRRVVEALLQAVPGIGSVAALLLLVFYVFSVIATKLFGGAFPQWFGTIGESMYSLFQIMTLEKLVDGDRSSGHGTVSRRLGVLCSFYHCLEFYCPQPVHRDHRRFNAVSAC